MNKIKKLASNYDLLAYKKRQFNNELIATIGFLLVAIAYGALLSFSFIMAIK
jgi:hypothetical protein